MIAAADEPETRTRRKGDEGGQGPILVAVDFSEDSREAVLWASHEAMHLGARLIILHVVHDPAASPGFYKRMDEDWLRPMDEAAREMMDTFLAEMRASHPSLSVLLNVEIRFVTGLPAGRIVEVAKEEDATLIVIGSCGRTGLPHILLGSVAERVVQLAPMPTVVVKRQ